MPGSKRQSTLPTACRMHDLPRQSVLGINPVWDRPWGPFLSFSFVFFFFSFCVRVFGLSCLAKSRRYAVAVLGRWFWFWFTNDLRTYRTQFTLVVLRTWWSSIVEDVR